MCALQPGRREENVISFVISHSLFCEFLGAAPTAAAGLASAGPRGGTPSYPSSCAGMAKPTVFGGCFFFVVLEVDF